MRLRLPTNILIHFASASRVHVTLLVAITVLISSAFLRASEVPTGRPVIKRLTKTYFPKFFVCYSPDGSHLAYCRHHRNRRGANRVLVGLRVIKADGSGDRPLLSEFDSQVQIQEHPSWSADGKQLLISGGGNDTGNSSKDTFVCDIDEKLQATNLRKLVAGQSVMLGEEPCFSPDNRHVAFVSIDETLWMADADGKNKTRIVQVDGQYCHQPAWSPDGQWIAFATDRDGDVELYKVRWDGTDLTRLTDSTGFDCRPRWSRDGAWLLFTSNRDGNHNLYLTRPDGTEVRRLTEHSAIDDHGAWSPDGKSIAFVSMRDGGFDLYRLDLPSDIKIGPKVKPVPLTTEGAGGLVAHYDFDQPVTDNVVRDLVSRHHLRLFGAEIKGPRGHGALSFDGKDDYAVAGNGAQLRIGGPLTISFWVRPDKVAGNGYLISKYGWNVYIASDRRPRFETRTAKNRAWDTLPAATALKPNAWSFITAVFDDESKTLSIYLDGKLSAERARTDGGIGATAAYPLQLGTYTASKTQHFRGQLDEIRIYRNALNRDDIAKEYEIQKQKVVGSD